MATASRTPRSPRSKISQKDAPEVPLAMVSRTSTLSRKKSSRKKLQLTDEGNEETITENAKTTNSSKGRSGKNSVESGKQEAPATPSRYDISKPVDTGTPIKLAESEKKVAAVAAATAAVTSARASLLMPELPSDGITRRLVCSPEVQSMYKVVHRCTGSLGGNGAGGAIYGELTQSSMQRVIDLMIRRAELDTSSIFIDVGAGLGKPNLHVAINPAVRYSIGVEMEHVRWHLSMHNLKHYLDTPCTNPEEEKKKNVIFMHGDITNARSLNPFSHVYMFDIGFPPALFLHIAECLRKSTTVKYVLCYHRPQLMIKKYGFDMDFIEKQATSMHGKSFLCLFIYNNTNQFSSRFPAKK